MPTEPSSFWQRRWKLIVNLITFLALLILVIAIHSQLAQTLENLKHVSLWALLLMIPIEIINYVAQAKAYQGLFQLLGDKLGFKHLAKLSVELNFVNHVFPSGGVTGISYFSMRLRQDDMKAGKSTLVHLMKVVLVILSFEILLISGFIIMAAGGHANNLIILLCGALSVLLIFGTIGFGYMLESKPRIDRTFMVVTNLVNRLIHIVRRHHPETISIDKAKAVIEDLHANYGLFRRQWRSLQTPFWWAFVANLTEILAVYVVYVAFGEWVNFGAVILAYAVANFAGLISVLPGGIGVYEGLMTIVLATAGVPAALSLPVTIMYRVINTAIQLPPGYYLYHRNLRRTGTGQPSHGG